MNSIDRAGRWLVRHRHPRTARRLAWLVMRPDARRHADAYTPLWIERWTVRDVSMVMVSFCARPGDVTAEVGAVAMLEQLGRQP